MNDLYLVYTVGAVLAVVAILLSRPLQRSPLSEPMLGLLAGVLLGPFVLGWLSIPESIENTLLIEASRAALAVSLIGVALRFPVRSLRPALRPVLVLLLVVMPISALVTGVLGYFLLGLPFALALLLGACLCPTDPVLASGVVSGKEAEETFSERSRQVITEESGANDGLAILLVLLAAAPLVTKSAPELLSTALYQVGVGLVVGAALGFLVGFTSQKAREGGEMGSAPSLFLTLFLAFAALGAARLLEGDGILAVFVAGLCYNFMIGDQEEAREDAGDEALNRYLGLPFFLLLGVVLPLSEWAALGWGALAFVVLVFLLRRPPAVLLAKPLLGMGWRDVTFLGWFGPMGVSALFYLVLSHEEGVVDPRLFAAGTLVIAASVVVHGVTALPARKLYRRVSSTK